VSIARNVRRLAFCRTCCHVTIRYHNQMSLIVTIKSQSDGSFRHVVQDVQCVGQHDVLYWYTETAGYTGTPIQQAIRVQCGRQNDALVQRCSDVLVQRCRATLSLSLSHQRSRLYRGMRAHTHAHTRTHTHTHAHTTSVHNICIQYVIIYIYNGYTQWLCSVCVCDQHGPPPPPAAHQSVM
jgi:hypothetical protein